jgi:hypothetical protein
VSEIAGLQKAVIEALAMAEVRLPYMWPTIVKHFMSHVLASHANHGAVRRMGPSHVHGMLAGERFNKWLKRLSAAQNGIVESIAREYSQAWYLDIAVLEGDPSLCDPPAYLRKGVTIKLPTHMLRDRVETVEVTPGSPLSRVLLTSWSEGCAR